MTTENIRIGIIGTGGMANQHADRFEKIAGVEVVSCFDVDHDKAKSFAERHHIRHVAEDTSALYGLVDAVSIVTPDRSHADLCLEAFATKKHVLCEKPLTVTLNDARTVAEAAERAGAQGIIHMVNFSYRFSAAFQEAIRLTREGALGEIRHLHSFYLQSWLAGPGYASATLPDSTLWRLSTSMGSGGVLGDLGCHILDMTSAAGQDFQSVRCALNTFPKKIDGVFATEFGGRALDANDTAIIELALTGGGSGVCQTSRWATGHSNHLRLEVHGTEGALCFDLDRDPNAIDLCLGDDLASNTWKTKHLAPTPSNWARFIESIRTGVQGQPDMVRGAQVQAYLDACERSARSGHWEDVSNHLPAIPAGSVGSD